MIIGTAGFSWSGSSAATDYLKEFDENQVYDNFEFIIAYHPDGLSDLDYNLNIACNKFLSSNTAIHRFRKIAKHLLGKPTNGKIVNITEQFIDSITQVKWTGCAQGQNLYHNETVYNILSPYTYKFLRRLPVKFCKTIRLYPISTIEFSVRPENFIENCHIYTESILNSLGLDTSKNIVLDQPFSGNNPVASLKYYRDAKAIVVDRDPRELYLLAKCYFPKTSYQVPYDNVEDFISYYGNMHKVISESIANPDVLYLKFEDMVYNYEKTTKKIREFLKLGENHHKKMYFDPGKSMANTQLFRKCADYKDDIKKIEESLTEYIFDFSPFYNIDTNGKMFD